MTFRILSAPGRGSDNPYIDSFYDALAPHGIELVGPLQFDQSWLTENMHEFDAIHLHWPESLWRSFTYRTLRALQQSGIRGTWRLSKFIEKAFYSHIAKESLHWLESVLIFLKSNKKHVIWTWHNYRPHENANWQDTKALQILAQHADLTIFHNEFSAQQSLSNYDIQGQVVVMSHGNYDGVYPYPRNKATIISELGLHPDLPIVGMLGNIREYKGIDIAIEACAQLDGRVQFLCAGNLHESFEWEAVVRKASALTHCALIPRFVSDQAFADYAHVSDILVMPYRRGTGSGALLAALTLGKGVVASDLPFFREVLGNNEKAGLLVSPNNPDELSKGINQYLQTPIKTREESAFHLADKFKWEDCVLAIVPYIKQLGKS